MAVILLIGGVIAGFTVVLGVMSFALLGRDDVPDPQVDFCDPNEFLSLIHISEPTRTY